jgi:hypothetical protein
MSNGVEALPGRRPTTRRTVIAQDPSVRVGGKILTAQVEVPAEKLEPGPTGYRVQVVDYDATRDRFLAPAPVWDEDPFAGVRGDRLVEAPAFHAHNAYAIVMSTLARFERALGRRVPWGFRDGGHQLKVVPHAFVDANAFYSRRDESLLFGYFGERKPVFTCLSHDIVVHETTHALLDGLRPQFLLPSSPQQGAIHEGFSDVVAILSVFRLGNVVDAMLRLSMEEEDNDLVIEQRHLTVDRLKMSALFQLAHEMGRELPGARGEGLRHSLNLDPSPRHLAERTEPHELGEVLVAAMLRAFLAVWVRRLFPNGRRGVTHLDRIHVVREGTKAADHLLTMAIRALDYTPPVDLQLAEYLSALLTADTDLNPDDSAYGYREALRKAFADYGITPEVNAGPGGSGTFDPPVRPVSYDRTRHEAMTRDAEEVFRFVWENRKALGLEPDAYTCVQSVRPTVRVNADGFVLRETVAEYVQRLSIQARELPSYGLRKPKGMDDWMSITLYGGGTLIFDDYGRLKLDIGSGVRSKKRQQRRLDHLFETGQLDHGSADPDLAHMHRLRGGGPSLADPYRERRDA